MQLPLPKSILLLLLTCVGSLLLFLSWTAPLSQHWTTGIPSSASNLEEPAWRTGIAGDHLQLLYHFDLAGDMVNGKIPWFTNPYEFNTGDDAARFRPGAYFAPMSLVYASLRGFIGQAAAWNTTLWISVWMSALFGYLWFRSMGASTLAATPGLLLLLAAPFRWGSLLGGSPAGIALMWVPYFLWRLDKGLTTPRIRDGFLIGIGLVLLFWGDLQVFYVTSLTAPFFVLLTVGWKWDHIKRIWKGWWKLAPGGGICLGFIGLFYLWRKSFLSASLMSEGRTWHELAIFSPRPISLVEARPGPGETVYVGIAIFLLLGSAFLALLTLTTMNKRDRDWCKAATGLLAAGVLLFAISVALGTYGPRGGWAIQFVRERIPYFVMIRQSFKVFAIVPAVMAWMLTAGLILGYPRLQKVHNHLGPWVCTILSVLVFWNYAPHIHATVSLLPSPDPAYDIVARDAANRGIENPRILVIPLWPGDSAETSVPMHLAQHYGLRMVNGYSPVVSEEYFNETFRGLESMNQGHFTAEQMALLKEMGVEHILVHEDRFPEKVSPFPITSTLDNFYVHNHLNPLAQSESVHAFRIQEIYAHAKSFAKQTSLLIPARRYEAERLENVPAEQVQPEEYTQGGSFVRLQNGPLLKTQPARVVPDPENHWYVRVRGQGTLHSATLPTETEFTGSTTQVVSSENWTWIKIPMQTGEDFVPYQLNLKVAEGEVDVDVVVLSGTQNLLSIPQEGIRIPASRFFHAGFMNRETGSVTMRPTHEPANVIWYGPLLPLEPGTYTFRLHHKTQAVGTVGEVRSGFHREAPVHIVPVSGEVTEWTWEVPASKLWRVEFFYNRSAPIELLSLEIVPQRTDR